MKPRLAAKDATPEERRAAAALMGSARTPAKMAAVEKARAARSPEQLGGVKPRSLQSIPCTCDAGEALEGHRWNCARGQAIKRRTKQNRDLLTGLKPEPAP